MASIIIMYQAVHFLHMFGIRDFTQFQLGFLTSWISNAIGREKEKRHGKTGTNGFNGFFSDIVKHKYQELFWVDYLMLMLFEIQPVPDSAISFGRRVVNYLKQRGICMRCQKPVPHMSDIPYHVFDRNDIHNPLITCKAPDGELQSAAPLIFSARDLVSETPEQLI